MRWKRPTCWRSWGLRALFEIRAIGIARLAAAVGAFVVFALPPTAMVIVSQSQKGAFDHRIGWN